MYSTDSETHLLHLLLNCDSTLLLKMVVGGERAIGLEVPPYALLASEPQFYCTAKWADGHTLALLEELLCQTIKCITKLLLSEQGLLHPRHAGGTARGIS